MLYDLPFLPEVLAVLAAISLVFASTWPSATSFIVRWPALSASALFFGAVLSAALLSRALDGISFVLIGAMLVFLSAVGVLLLMARAAADDIPQERGNQQ